MRKKSKVQTDDAPRLEPDDVARFFEVRAEKARDLGSVRAVIYQDKHADLAERRDTAEKAKLLPFLGLGPSHRVLDIGCGTGRWTGIVAPLVAHYHGVDFSEGLIEVARGEHVNRPNVRYSVLPSADVTREALGETEGFQRVLQLGVLIYLNDEAVTATMMRIAEVAALNCRVLLREPVCMDGRLTIKDHYSEDLSQVYNAIYRSETELLAMFEKTLIPAGFSISASGDVYDEDGLNNRAETRQRYYLLERGNSDL